MYRPPRFSLGDIFIFLNELFDRITSRILGIIPNTSDDYILICDMNFHYDTIVCVHYNVSTYCIR